MRFTVAALAVGLLVPVSVQAQPPPEASKLPTISGFVNTTYNYNLNRPVSVTNGVFSYNRQHNNIALNAAHLVVAGDVGSGVSYVLELDMGADAAVNAGTSTIFDIQEAYGVYKNGNFGLRAGKFVTFNGIEVIESPANPTISRGYLFGLAEPFTHVGAEVFYQVTPMLDIHVGVVNGWDLVTDNNTGKTLMAKVGLAPTDKIAITVSGYLGPEQAGNNRNRRTTGDLTAVIKLGMADIWVQGNYGQEAGVALSGGDAKWFGAGLQPVLHLSDAFNLGLRAEFFKDSDGARTKAVQQLINISVAPSYALTKNFSLRAEGRVDISDQDVFDDSKAMGTPQNVVPNKKNQVVLLAEGIVAF